MTIFFSGQNFKYELEGVCKLFLPLVRFKHCFDDMSGWRENDVIVTRRKRLKNHTMLHVRVNTHGAVASRGMKIENNIVDYEGECERFLAVSLFYALQKIMKVTPKWGILTGVRPVSILQKLRKRGLSDEEIREHFKEKYLVSDSKLGLAFLTANTQAPLLKSFKQHSYSLYVAIPFCVSRCSYCSFVSHAIDRPRATDKIDEYLHLLCKELEATASVAKKNEVQLDTIYVGGGTPTALSAENLKRVTDAIATFFPVDTAREYTIEAGRADTITREKLEVIKNSGANRISINPQSFNDNVLKAVGRKHTAQDVVDCYKLAREMGFECINMDLIAGLPSDTTESFKASIDTAIALSPENITVHTLSIKRSADLFFEDGIEEYVKKTTTSQMTDYSQEALIKSGYLPYYLYRQKNTIGNLENVGYSKNGFESYYNVYIMDEMQTILACGAGGATKLVKTGAMPISRIFNFKYHFEYIDRFDEILKRKEAIEL